MDSVSVPRANVGSRASSGSPASSAPLAKLGEVAPPATPKVEVDDSDLALLRELASDARQSQRALARAIEMSAPAVADRLARPEPGGGLPGYPGAIPL